MPAGLNPVLTELSLERLRRSVKWTRYPADVLPAFVAEMDFPLAEPVRVALAEAIERELANGAAAQIERILAGEGTAYVGTAPGPIRKPLDPALQRVCSHLITAIGRAFAEGEISEGVALARPACGGEGEYAAACAEITHLLDEAERHAGPPPPGRRFDPRLVPIRNFSGICVYRA